MIRGSSFGTVVTALSGVAGIVCLMTGLQLWFLGDEFGRILQQDPAAASGLLAQWQVQARMASAMSIGSGALVFLLVIRHIATGKQLASRTQAAGRPDTGDADEIESISVRIFEVDAHNRTSEIGAEPHPLPPPKRPLRLKTVKTDLPSPVDQTESIIRNIHEVAETGADSPAPGAAPPDRLAFLRRLFFRR
jgi:hypothetical protein